MSGCASIRVTSSRSLRNPERHRLLLKQYGPHLVCLSETLWRFFYLLQHTSTSSPGKSCMPLSSSARPRAQIFSRTDSSGAGGDGLRAVKPMSSRKVMISVCTLSYSSFLAPPLSWRSFPLTVARPICPRRKTREGSVSYRSPSPFQELQAWIFQLARL